MTNTGTPQTDRPGVPQGALEWTVGTAAFAVEIALAVTVAVAGYRSVDGGPLGWLVGAAALVVLFAIWGRWMSPRAPRRLPLPGRLILGSALTLAAAAAIAVTGALVWGIVLAVVGVAVILVGQPLLDH